jgi:heterodisulfide reductase subunit A-like polyferredoxin
VRTLVSYEFHYFKKPPKLTSRSAAFAVATISQLDAKTTATKIRSSSSNTQLFAATLEKKGQQKQTPVRTPDTPDQVQEVRERLRAVSVDAANAKGCSLADTGDEWWRLPSPPSPKKVTAEQPLRVIIAGGGVAGLVAAAACHAKGMKVQIFKQAS